MGKKPIILFHYPVLSAHLDFTHIIQTLLTSLLTRPPSIPRQLLPEEIPVHPSGLLPRSLPTGSLSYPPHRFESHDYLLP